MEANKDHDLLIKLSTKVELIIDQIKELKEGTMNTVEDHEKRISDLERSKVRQNVTLGIYIGMGIFIAGLLIYHIVGRV